jgi:hypothetical protein
MVIIGIVLIILVMVVYYKGYSSRRATSETDASSAQPDRDSISDTEIKKLEAEKEEIKKEILKVRKDMRMETITKNKAREKERALKDRFKEIDTTIKRSQAKKE